MYKMNNQERENLYQFIDSVPPYLWINWIGVCGCILEFYSSKRHEYSVENDLAFFVDLLKNSELNISIFRTRFKAYIESNNGKFKDLTPFPLYFTSRDKKIINPTAEKIRLELFKEKDTGNRNKLINELSRIHENDNPHYQALTKNEEAEHCLYWSIRYCRSSLDDKSELVEWLPRATFLYGYACGLLEMNSEIMSYYKLNEDKSPQEKGGQVLKNKAEFAKSQVITLWSDRFKNPHLKKKGKAEFGRYIYDNPHLIKDEQGNPLKKPTGENYYNDPKYIETLLPKNT